MSRKEGFYDRTSKKFIFLKVVTELFHYALVYSSPESLIHHL